MSAAYRLVAVHDGRNKHFANLPQKTLGSSIEEIKHGRGLVRHPHVEERARLLALAQLAVPSAPA